MKSVVLLFTVFCFWCTAAVAQSGLQRLDDRILIDLSHHRTPQQTGFMMFISKYNDVVNFAVPAGVFAGGVIGGDKGTRQDAAYIASSSAFNVILTMALKQLIRRPRPFAANVRINAVYQPPHYSFPSGHSSSAFTTATAVSQVQRKWYITAPAFLWAGAIGYSRMYLGVHYPTDVAAGALLGVGSASSLKFIKK